MNEPDGLYELSIRDCSSKSGNLEEVLENKMTKEREVSNFAAIENDKALGTKTPRKSYQLGEKNTKKLK